MSYHGPVGLGVRYSNGKKDPKFKFLIQYTPDKAGEAIKEIKKILNRMKKYHEETKDEPYRFDFDREKF